MISRKFKDDASRLLQPVAIYLQKIEIYPNQLTLFGFMLSLLAATAYAGGRSRLGGLALLLSGFSDTLDGSLARNTGTSSPFGAFIDSVADRYSEFFVFFGLLIWLYRGEETTHLIVLFMALMGSIMVSYTRARAESIIGECKVGIMERPERIIILILFSFLDAVKPAIWILAVGANFTALQRIVFTYKTTKRQE